MAADKAKGEITFVMTKKKDTIGTVVFEAEEAAVSQLYIAKGAGFDAAQSIQVTIAVKQ